MKRKRVQIFFNDPSLTDQSQKDDCDIRTIIESYIKKGEPFPSTMSYVDCTSLPDYQNAMYLISEVQTNFEQLPAKVRDEFKTVENYLSFISNPKNAKQSIDKGLIDRNTVPIDILKSLYPDKYLSDIEKDEIVSKQFQQNNGVKSENSSTPPNTDTQT